MSSGKFSDSDLEGIEITDKDVISNESLWDLYERWTSHHRVSRDLSEKHRRFNIFKENAMHFHKLNQHDSEKIPLHKFADMTEFEFEETYCESNHLKITDEDLISDESIWNLYERCISHYEMSRDESEKHRRFNTFKAKAIRIHKWNKKPNKSYRAGLNKFTDMFPEEVELCMGRFVE